MRLWQSELETRVESWLDMYQFDRIQRNPDKIMRLAHQQAINDAYWHLTDTKTKSLRSSKLSNENCSYQEPGCALRPAFEDESRIESYDEVGAIEEVLEMDIRAGNKAFKEHIYDCDPAFLTCLQNCHDKAGPGESFYPEFCNLLALMCISLDYEYPGGWEEDE